MLEVQRFLWNPFRENGYVLFDETGECLIIDPGCYEQSEENLLVSFISKNKLKPVMLLNTHCHIDHVLGNRFVFDQYGLLPAFHSNESAILHEVPVYAPSMGMRYLLSPEAGRYIMEDELISFGNTRLKALFTPGHSPGSLSFYNAESHILISGDALFFESIGRTDLPGGDTETLLKSIRQKLFTLDEQTRVFPGHGTDTTIGHELTSNPFLQQ